LSILRASSVTSRTSLLYFI